MTVKNTCKYAVRTGNNKGSPLLAIFLSYFVAGRSYTRIIDIVWKSGNSPAKSFAGCNKTLRNRFRLMMGEKTGAWCIGLFEPSTFLAMILHIIFLVKPGNVKISMK
jgi:hypothetical protein